jgi:hypothetical protein
VQGVAILLYYCTRNTVEVSGILRTSALRELHKMAIPRHVERTMKMRGIWKNQNAKIAFCLSDEVDKSTSHDARYGYGIEGRKQGSL